MRIIVTRSEKNLSALARRLFTIEGPHAAAAERKAITALRRANPSLLPSGTLSEGAPIVVPDVEGLASPTTAAAPTADVLKEMAKELRTALARVNEALEEARTGQKKALESDASDLKDYGRELKAMGDIVAERLAAVDKAVKRRAKELSERHKLDDQAVSQLGKDLDGLLKALG
jgi:hypothetical protein